MLKQSLATAQHAVESAASAGVGSANALEAAPVAPISHKEKLKSEIEAIISSECLYCGNLMINALDKPFVENWQQADSEWD